MQSMRECVCVCDIHITGCQQSLNFWKETKECENRKDWQNEREKKTNARAGRERNTQKKSFEVFSAYPISSLHLISHALSFETKTKRANEIQTELIWIISDFICFFFAKICWLREREREKKCVYILWRDQNIYVMVVDIEIVNVKAFHLFFEFVPSCSSSSAVLRIKICKEKKKKHWSEYTHPSAAFNWIHVAIKTLCLWASRFFYSIISLPLHFQRVTSEFGTTWSMIYCKEKRE